MKIKVVTFNLRMDNRGDGINYFFNRSPMILDWIRETDPDIICFQEATERILAWLRANLIGYTVVGTGRSSELLDEANPIAFKSDKFSLFSLDQFWLSPMPDVPGSRYEEQSICPRICMASTLCFCTGGKNRLIRVYNSHLDHISDRARLLGMQSILERIGNDNRRMPLPTVLTGDFNAEPDEECITLLNSYSEYPLRDVTADIPVSFHDFGRMRSDSKIDYIYSNSEVSKSAQAATLTKDGFYLSDHYPIVVELDV